MKCLICHKEFKEWVLSEVFEHEHAGLECSTKLSSQVGKSYRDEESVSILKIYFSPKDREFDVTYRNGKTYRYFDFSLGVFQQALRSTDIGKFLANRVKGKYSYVQL